MVGSRLGVVAFVTLVCSASTRAAQTPTFHAQTELVHVSVSVLGPNAKYISGLDAGQFTVLEDNIPQSVRFFAGGDLALDLVILVDSSDSMTDSLGLVQEAAVRFARTIRRGDRASVMSVGGGLRILQPFTGDLAAIEDAIRATRAGGRTPLYSALYVTLTELAREARLYSTARRQAIVVLSDGQDTGGTFPFDTLLEAARRHGVPIFPVAPRPPAKVRLNRERFYGGSTRGTDFDLRRLAADTGGRAFFPVALNDLKTVYADIADELAHQYSIGYQSSNASRDGGYRRISVRVDAGPGVTWRARGGYSTESGPPASGGSR